MRSSLPIGISFFFLSTCIPLHIAPNIADYRITEGEIFKKDLSKREMFVFEDPKDADHFYNYVATKFQLYNENVYDDVPFTIVAQQFFFSFYEVVIPDKIINLFPAVLDIFTNAALGNEDMDPYFPDGNTGYSRIGNWYIAIEVYSDIEKDCLHMVSLSREVVLEYLRTLKKEYLSTHNYNEVVSKN